jgi:hypothetical protein
MPSVPAPAPVGGWNARDSLDSIPSTDAIELVNLFPESGCVSGRGGSVTVCTLPGGQPVDTLTAFTPEGTSSFIAASNGKFYNVTTFSAPVQIGTGFANNQWQHEHFTNKIIFVNGVDVPQQWDGTTLSPMTISLGGSPSMALSLAPGSLGAGTYYYRAWTTYGSTVTAATPEQSIVVPAKLSTPTAGTHTTATTGGFFAPGTYYIRISATNAVGETLASVETSIVVPAGTNTNTITWKVLAVPLATGYNYYRSSTAGTELLLGSSVGLTFTDDGSHTPAGALPASNTTSGGVTVTITPISGITNYKFAGRTTGAELLMATQTSNVFTDDGSVTPSGAIPTVDTTGTNLLGVANMKGRAFYWENKRAGFWYAIAGAYQGNLIFFPLDRVFRNGGYVLMIVTWSRDNGDGVDDMTAIISNNGETLVYQGTDPGNALAWSMVGRFQIGRPLSVRSHGKLASSEILCSMDGFVSMDEAIVNQRVEEVNYFGGKIIRAANKAASDYQGNFGWEAIYYPRGQMFIINVPISNSPHQAEQYIRNTNTGAWCRFTGQNARTWGLYNDRLYFGTAVGTIMLADANSNDTVVAYGDDGVAVERRATTAYMRFNPEAKSQLTAVQIVSTISQPSSARVQALSDFNDKPLTAINPAIEFVPGQWNVSNWNQDYWAAAQADAVNMYAKRAMYSVNEYGFNIALRIRYSFRYQPFIWYSSTFVFNPGGL